MRARSIALAAASAALLLAGCGSSQEPEASPTPTPAAVTTEEVTERTVDPDAPEPALLAESDDMGHKMCELWTTALEDENDLRDVVEDLDWYGEQAKNDFMRSPVSTDEWGSGNPAHTDVLCHWNGYETEDGSPSDLLD